MFSKIPGPAMSKQYLSPITYVILQKQNERKIRNRELQEILDGRTDGENSQQKAAAFPDNHLSSLFVENCLFTCNTGVVQHYYGNLKSPHPPSVLGTAFPFTNSSELNPQR